MDDDKVLVTTRKFVKVGHIDEFQEDKGVLFKYGKSKVAIFKYKNEFYAIDSQCPHQRGNLRSFDLISIEDTSDKSSLLNYYCKRSFVCRRY